MPTKIQWTDEVWNPVTGCTPCSTGCDHCYARKIAWRFWGDRKFSDIRCHPARLHIPSGWTKPRLVFVNSMGDLFHEDVPDAFIHNVFQAMEKASQHIFIILTKRPDRMIERVPVFPLPNVWLGVSAESQATAEERIPLLLQIPAVKRLVSVEPMLEEIDLNTASWGEGRERPAVKIQSRQLEYPIAALDWVICGCESGTAARPFSMDWARSLRDQCASANVPFFFKQARIDGRLVKMPLLDGVMYDQYPVEING